MYSKKILSRFTFATALVTTSLFFSSCGEHAEESIADFEVTDDTIQSEARVNFDLLRVNIPAPSILTKKMSAAKIAYNKSLMLPISKRSSYSSTYQKAIGLGAFGADIAMAASHNQSQDALDYLGEMGKLAADLGLSSAFDLEFCKKMIANMSKQDTLELLLDKAFDKAERNLRSNQRVSTAVLMITAAWVEGLYTAVESVNSNPHTAGAKDIYNDISAHCHSFDYVYNLLVAYNKHADCAKLLKEMEPSKDALLAYGKSGWDASALPKLRDTVTMLRNKITA